MRKWLQERPNLQESRPARPFYLEQAVTIIAGIDVETTGFDPEKDEITELAYVIKRWGDPKPFCMQSYMCKVEGEVSEEITKLTGITKEHCDRGLSLATVLDTFYSDCYEHCVEFFVAHNAAFDMSFLKAVNKTRVVHTPISVLCTMDDIDWGPRNRVLTYLAADHGFLNPFPHAALFDVMTMLKVAEHYPLESIIERSKSPNIFIKAQVSYDDRELAKERRYRWEKIDNMHFPKTWVKKIKAMDLGREREAPFTVEILNGN